MSGTELSSPLRGESGPQEQCYKCQGEGGEPSLEGPHQLWHPCFKCGNTGRLPAGTYEADMARRCPTCLGAGGEQCQSEEDPQPGGWWENCGDCRGSGLRRGAHDEPV